MNDTEYEILLKELQPLVQKEFEQISEIRRLTQELAKSLEMNDQVTVKMLLKMRGEAMTETERAVRNQEKLLSAGKTDSKKLSLILSGDPAAEKLELNDIEKRIFTLKRAKKESLKKTIETDRIVNKRLTGSKSFYLR